MAWMSGGHGDGHDMAGMGPGGAMAAMPGMASSADLRRLRQSTGPALDTLFLQLMLRHHEGGTGMLGYGKDHAQTAEVRNLADQMLTAQTAEADLMKRMLAQRGAQPLPL